MRWVGAPVCAYDTLGRRTRVTFPDGSFTSSSFDAEGNETQTTDRAGRITTYTYDELKRVVRTTLPNGSFTQTIYSPGGRVTATIDGRGNRSDYAYDGAARQVSTTLPFVANGPGGPLVRPQISTEFNALGAPSSRTDPAGRVTSFAYDAAGRLVQTTYPDGSKVQQSWDAKGRRTSITNEEGQTTNFTYDGLGRLIAVAGLAGDAGYTYDEAGNVLTQTDALGRVGRFRYDALNRLIERRYPGGETERFAYDAAGNPVLRIDGLGRATTLMVDAMNRPTQKVLPGGNTVSYTYMADGQRASVTDSRGVTNYAYDGSGRLASITHPTGETVNYTRDANGNVVSIAAASGALGYAYDALDRLAQVTATEGAATASYDLAGNRVRQTAANGIVTDSAFDLRNRPTSVSHKTGGGTVLHSFSTTYSPSGRRTKIIELDGAVDNFSYDSRGRLSTETRTGTNPYSISHTYDAVANRLQVIRDGTPTTFTYDVNDRLVSDGATTYAWDANGNLVSRTQGANVTIYGSDTENRLVSIQGGGVAEQYTYDDDGNRVAANRATGTTRFLVDGINPTGLSQVLEERDGGGNLKARYSYGNELLAMQIGGASHTHLRDALGSTRSVTDVTGAVTDRYQFDAYGNTVSALGSTANPYRYRGERLDAESGLYHLRARQYSPSAGRFLARDPFIGRLESPISLHRYLYANADPVGHFDPTGRESLVSLTVAQSISNTIKTAETASNFNQACNAFSTLGTVGYTVMAGELAYGFATAWFEGIGSFKTTLTVLGFNPAPLKRTDIKSADLRVEPGPKFKLAFAMQNGTSQAGSLGPDGFNVSSSGPIKIGKTELKKELKKCETISIGAVSLKQTSTNWMGIPVPTIIPALSIEIEMLKFIRNAWKLFDGISVDLQSATGF